MKTNSTFSFHPEEIDGQKGKRVAITIYQCNSITLSQENYAETSQTSPHTYAY